VVVSFFVHQKQELPKTYMQIAYITGRLAFDCPFSFFWQQTNKLAAKIGFDSQNLRTPQAQFEPFCVYVAVDPEDDRQGRVDGD
jgi:hypothetical protein